MIIVVVMYESEMTCAALAGCMEHRSYDGVLRVMTLKTKLEHFTNKERFYKNGVNKAVCHQRENFSLVIFFTILSV